MAVHANIREGSILSEENIVLIRAKPLPVLEVVLLSRSLTRFRPVVGVGTVLFRGMGFLGTGEFSHEKKTFAAAHISSQISNRTSRSQTDACWRRAGGRFWWQSDRLGR